MSALVGLLGFSWFFVCFIWLIVNLFKRKPKKKPAIGMAVCFILFVVAISMDSPTKNTNRKPNESNHQDIQDVKTSESAESIQPSISPSEPEQSFEIDPSTLKGRGWSDSGRSEPHYEGIRGYVAIDYADTKIKKTDKFSNTPWEVPIYEKDKQFYIECGYVDHKTEVIVKSQELEHEGYGAYSGYLTVERADTGEELCIDVGNFITNPYWMLEDKVEAAADGYYIAEFNQISDYYPVNKSGEKVDLEDGFVVLVTGKTGLYGRNGPDNSTNQIEAEVFKEWKYGYGGVSVFFNEKDLTIVY